MVCAGEEIEEIFLLISSPRIPSIPTSLPLPLLLLPSSMVMFTFIRINDLLLMLNDWNTKILWDLSSQPRQTLKSIMIMKLCYWIHEWDDGTCAGRPTFLCFNPSGVKAGLYDKIVIK